MAKTNNDKTLRDFEKMSSGLQEADSRSDALVVDDSTHLIDPAKNMVKPPQVSKTGEEARRASRLRASKTGQHFDETNTEEEELSAADEDLMEDFTVEIVDSILGIE